MNTTIQKLRSIASPLLIIFAFALPLSTSAASVLAILLFFIWLISGKIKETYFEIKRNPVAIAVLLYLCLHLIGLLWTEDIRWGIQVLEKQWKLLLFPVFLSTVKKEHIHYYLAAFVAAIFVKACKAYMVWLGFITLPAASIFTTMGTSHVIYNPMLALACYIVLQHILFSTAKPAVKYCEIGLFLFLTCNMFITAGRTGQVVFFVLLAVALFQFFYPQSKKKLLFSICLLPLLVMSIFHYSPTFQNRINTAIHEIQNFDSQAITSMGCRIWFYKNTTLVIQQNWLLGTGTGDFSMEYATINHIHSANMPNTDNPHNQYLLITAQLGIVGLISLIAIFITIG